MPGAGPRSPAASEQVAVGLIVSTHGIAGELKVRSLSGESGHLLGLHSVVLRKGSAEREVELVRVRAQGAGLLVTAAGLDTPEKARALVGFEIWVPRAQGAPLGRDEYYAADLCRCALRYNGEEVGRVRSVWEGGPTQLLEVQKKDGATFLVPFSDHFVGEVDLEGGTILLKEGDLLP